MSALTRAAALTAPRRGRLTLSVVLGAATIAAAVGLLATSGWLIVRAAERPPILQLTMAIVAVRTFGLSRAVLRYSERLVSHDLAFRVLADLRTKLFARLAPLVPAGLPRMRTGDLLSRFVADVDRLQDLYLRALAPPLVAAVTIALAAGVGLAVLPIAALALTVSLLLAATAVPLVTIAAGRSAARRQAPARAALSAELVEGLEGAAELAVLGQDRARLERVRVADARLAGLVRRDALAGGLATALGTLIPGLAIVAVVAVAVPAVQDGRLHGTALGLLALLTLAAFEGVNGLPAAALATQACAESAERLEDVLDAPVPVRDPEHPRRAPAGTLLDVRRADVRLGGSPILHAVDLRIARGHAVALVGPSGGGKTTLAHLLVRFRDPMLGSVALDGIDLRDLAQDDVRRRVLLAAQDAQLFTTTIRENLMLANREASDRDLWDALDAVGLGEFVRGLPDLLGTLVGEDGGLLSGGQRRRLLVARALVSAAGILVLDEPAAHLDPPAVRALHERLAAERERRGVLVIAHAFAGLEGYDEIVVLEDGQITERGTHAELVRAGGRYARMALAQAAAA